MHEHVFRPGGFELTDAGARLAGIGRDSTVLDIGCGAGATLAHLAEKYGAAVWGIDLSAEAVRHAAELAPMASLCVGDACALPYEADMFDGAFMECTLSLFGDQRAALAEAHRVLKPGGTLVISTISSKGSDVLLDRGMISPPLLAALLCGLGFSEVTAEDRSDCLVQLYADIIFNYDTVEDYLRSAARTIGGAVITCETPFRECGYHILTARKRLL